MRPGDTLLCAPGVALCDRALDTFILGPLRRISARRLAGGFFLRPQT
jgi:hypothetical protein